MREILMEHARIAEGELVRHALKYAGWELRVFPLYTVREGACTCLKADCHSAGKHPRTRNGVKDATTEREQIQAWWQRWPDANIGIATGIHQGRGLYVIDIDSARGASFESLQDCNLAELLCSRIVCTGSGGYHIYLKCAEPLPNTANRLGPFIDTRGEGGYVVAPPSRNAYGPYIWETSLNRILPITPELLAKLKKHNLTENSHFTKKAEKTNEISYHTQLQTHQVIAQAQNVQSAHPAATVSQARGTGGPSDAPGAFFGPMNWLQQPGGIYQLSLGAHQIFAVPDARVPDLYTVLARLAPDFHDECWFKHAPLVWAQQRVEARARLFVTGHATE